MKTKVQKKAKNQMKEKVQMKVVRMMPKSGFGFDHIIIYKDCAYILAKMLFLFFIFQLLYKIFFVISGVDDLPDKTKKLLKILRRIGCKHSSEFQFFSFLTDIGLEIRKLSLKINNFFKKVGANPIKEIQFLKSINQS